jgi:hypothetical protein
LRQLSITSSCALAQVAMKLKLTMHTAHEHFSVLPSACIRRAMVCVFVFKMVMAVLI